MTVSPDKLVKHAQIMASDVIKRRWPNRYPEKPTIEYRQCVDDLVEMKAINPELIKLCGKKVALIHWMIDRFQLKNQPKTDANSFYKSSGWRRIRYSALKESNGKCACCGAEAKNGAILHVDHIKPRSLFPELALDPNNLQVLCEPCNLGKSNFDEADFRQ